MYVLGVTLRYVTVKPTLHLVYAEQQQHKAIVFS